MALPVPIVIAIIGLFWSSTVKLHAAILGAQFTIPVLWLIAAAVVLAITAAVLWLLRSLIRDGLRQPPAWRTA